MFSPWCGVVGTIVNQSRSDGFSVCWDMKRSDLRSITSADTVLSECYSFASAIRLYCSALCLDHAVLFDAQLQTERRAKCCVSIPRGSGSPLERSQRPCGYRGSPIHFGLVRFFMAIPTELRSRRHGVGTFLRKHIGLAMLSAGSTLGAARPQTCAKESNVEAALPPLWTLFTLRRGYVGANAHPCKKRQRPNQRTHACKTRVHGKTRPSPIYARAGRAV